MSDPDELRSNIVRSREALRTAIAAARNCWEQVPGEEWTPRLVAEHAIKSEVFFASEVCLACGYPGLDAWDANHPSADSALAGLEAAGAKADGRLKYVTDKDLVISHPRFGLVADVMALHARHLEEHANQIVSGLAST